MKKAAHADDRQSLTSLQQIMNIGPSIADDLNRIGVLKPQQLINRDPFELYDQLCEHDGFRYDPCVIDCFMSAVDFMNGNPPRKWWDYTPKRKEILLGQRQRSLDFSFKTTS